MQRPSTLGELKKSGYSPRGLKEEMRDNLIRRIQTNEVVFPGIYGYDKTVIPDMERAILSRHSILLLGLRGQAKTRLARLMVNLLDEYIPVVAGSELFDDPMQPISYEARHTVADLGDNTPIEWVHRSERYVEKLATPDVSIADLVGDIDPIKAANLKLPFNDERVIHYGLIPRAHRCIFVINELPDLQARIQVSLFNILQEGDLQIRGFKLRLPLDVAFVFTANPEDYTNRGTIITPLKDRIESQITTHYPASIEETKKISIQEAKMPDAQLKNITLPNLWRDVLETLAFEARKSEFVDQSSGVSARMTISALENLYSAAERRMFRNGEKKASIRFSDFWGVIPSITGKMELVYEGEEQGPLEVAWTLIGQVIKDFFLDSFENPEVKGRQSDPYGVIKAWFAAGNVLHLNYDMSEKDYESALRGIAGLEKVVERRGVSDKMSLLVGMELVLNGLCECGQLERNLVQNGLEIQDSLGDFNLN